jgi:hypothetical protein
MGVLLKPHGFAQLANPNSFAPRLVYLFAFVGFLCVVMVVRVLKHTLNTLVQIPACQFHGL